MAAYGPGVLGDGIVAATCGCDLAGSIFAACPSRRAVQIRIWQGSLASDSKIVREQSTDSREEAPRSATPRSLD